MWTIGEFKQELIKDYNDINRKLFDIGVKHQKVDVVENKILILAVHKRIPSMKHLDEKNRLVTRLADLSIIESFKEHLKGSMEVKYGMDIYTILKDYDPETEYSGTLILLKKEVSHYILDVHGKTSSYT